MTEELAKTQSVLTRAWLIAHRLYRTNKGTELAVDCERMMASIEHIENFLRIPLEPINEE